MKKPKKREPIDKKQLSINELAKNISIFEFNKCIDQYDQWLKEALPSEGSFEIIINRENLTIREHECKKIAKAIRKLLEEKLCT